MKIKLQTVIDAIEQASDAYTMLYDTKTNETVYLPDVEKGQGPCRSQGAGTAGKGMRSWLNGKEEL